MATNYTDLKGEIKAQIKPNGVGAITGQVLQDAMLNLVGATEAEMSALNAATDEKLAQLDQEWNAIKNADFTLNPNIEKVVLTESEVTLEPGKYYTWETPMAYLDIALIPPTQQNYVGKYIFSFTCPLNAPTYLNLPVGMVWNGVPDFKAGDTYLVFIYDNIAIFFADPKVETGFVTAEEVQAMIDATIVSSLNTPV